MSNKLFAFNVAREVSLPKNTVCMRGSEQGAYDEQAQVWTGDGDVLSTYTCTQGTDHVTFTSYTFPWKWTDADHFFDPFTPDKDGYGGPC